MEVEDSKICTFSIQVICFSSLFFKAFHVFLCLVLKSSCFGMKRREMEQIMEVAGNRKERRLAVEPAALNYQKVPILLHLFLRFLPFGLFFFCLFLTFFLQMLPLG